MVNIPVRFGRTAAAFDEAAAGRGRYCESSGSEHSADLCDLVNSFIEREIREQREIEEGVDGVDLDRDEIDDELELESSEFDEFKDSLKSLFDPDQNDSVKKSIYAEVEMALREVDDDLHGFSSLSSDLKRRLMARLRGRGLDAGLCKTKWEKCGRCPSGDYQYVDVNAAGNRYIIEINLAGEFTIARPTSGYTSLLGILPPIFVGKTEELKQVVKQMSNAIRKSMRRVGIHMPPWRRLAYMQAKWFGSYKRTANEVPNRNSFGLGRAGNRSVGFVPVVRNISAYCREDDFVGKGGVRVGNLASVFNQKEMLL